MNNFAEEGCKWTTQHDGMGSSDFALKGEFTPYECAMECKRRANTENKNINGATIRPSNMKCWCEVGMKEKVSDATYNTCFLEQGRCDVYA